MPEPNLTYQTLRRLHATSTKGTWRPVRNGWDIDTEAMVVAQRMCQQDAEYVSAAVNALPALLDVAEAAQEYMANLGGPGKLKDRLRQALAALEGVTHA